MEQLESLVRRNLRQANQNTEVDVAGEDIEVLGEDEFFLSVSPVMQKVRIQAELLAQTELPVLIVGEPGSGKGTVARLIHKLSVHGGFRFVRVNCSDMPADLLDIELFGARKGAAVGATGLAGGKTGAGKLEIGKNGTILLDEITAMPLALQTKLLQVLQDRRSAHSGEGRQLDVGLRILAASSDKMDRALAEKRLHEGLYHALSAFTIHVPPLRQRRDEINSLLLYSMHTVAKHYGLTPREFASSTLEACMNHSWPGNLEELQNFVKRYLVAGDSELPAADYESDSAFRGYENTVPMRVRSHSPAAVAASGGTAQKTLKSLIHGIKCETERTAIAAALDKTGWNRKAAARLLGVSYRTMLYKIDQYHMTSSESFVSPFADASLAAPDHSKGRG
jgi:two-component system response regulator AtoC